jgi:hypothetical protein
MFDLALSLNDDLGCGRPHAHVDNDGRAAEHTNREKDQQDADDERDLLGIFVVCSNLDWHRIILFRAFTVEVETNGRKHTDVEIVDYLVDAVHTGETCIVVVDRIPAIENLIARADDEGFTILRLELQACHVLKAVDGDVREAVASIELLRLALEAGLGTERLGLGGAAFAESHLESDNVALLFARSLA